MNKFLFQLLCLLALSLSYVVVFSTGKSQAESHAMPGVAPFMTPSGRLGLLEQGSGKIFVYDDNMGECVFIGQIKALGDPIEAVYKK
jgi:hypothetical protein